jgi:hypothetical protein
MASSPLLAQAEGVETWFGVVKSVIIAVSVVKA